MNSGTESLPRCVLEEIALEGLDGITIEGLWKRIGIRLKLSLPLKDKLTDAIWNYMKSVECLSYYLLPEGAREPLKIYDRADCTDPKTGAPTEPDECPYNAYKFNPITTDTVRGSCEHFDTRMELAPNEVHSMSHVAVEEEYGLRFVVVASQSLRNSMLIPASLPSNIELTISNYCILERLGRARYNGELANGKYSLSSIVGDPVHFHSIKKKLLRHKLVETQPIYHVINGQNFGSQLLHLPQFFAMFKPRHMMMTEKIIELLKEKPNYMATLQDIRCHFDEPLRHYFKRLVKHTFFQKFITISQRIPYRMLYPEASESEWRLKNKEERTITALQLTNPDMEMSEIWPETDPDVIDEHKGYLSESHEVFEVPLLVQVYDYIRASGEDGVSEPDIGGHFGMSRLVRRSVVKEIKRCAKIDRFVTNEGRQKTGRYLLPEYNKLRLEKLYSADPLAETGNNERMDLSIIVKMESSQNTDADATGADAASEVEPPANVSEMYDFKSNVLAIEEEPRESDNGANGTTESKEYLIDESDIDTQVIEIFKTKSCLRAHYKTALSEKSLTEKMLRRYRFMNTAIQANEFIDNPTRLYMLVVDDEKNRGLKDCMCRKTFNRLLTCLCVSKRIRLWRITFKYRTKLRALTYISANHIDTDYAMMQSCIKQARNRFILSVYEDDAQRANAHRRNHKSATLLAPASSYETPSAIVAGSRLTNASKHISNYGNTPKFARLRTLHEFLFYLVYESSAHTNRNVCEVISRDEAIEHWRRNETFEIAYDDLEDMPPVYSKTINWKVFVPPMELHKDFGRGWCLTSDSLFRMPLSVFVRVVNMAYEIRGLDEILSHPIKKHYLLNRLPVELQQALFHRRKYLFSIDDLLKRLCCMGLAQAGPQRLQSKDKRFYYFNRKATLLNTVTSQPGYLQTSVQDYPEKLYDFVTSVDLQMYWDDMYKICMATKLNRKSADDGSLPHYALLTDQVIKMACQPVDPAQAIQRDIGLLPGDHRGAAGLDTSFYAHIERNWSFNSNVFKNRPTLKALSTALSTPSNSSAPIRYNKLVRITRDSNIQKREIRIQPVPLHKLTTSSVRRRQPVTRRRAERAADAPRRKSTKNIIDDVDRAALKLMSSQRVEWSTPEDNFLLLCRLAQMYLATTANRTMPSTVIRDLIHWHCKSLNKTSRACARRIVYIMKQLTNSCQINHSVLSCLGEIKENKAIKRRFGNLASKLRILYPTDAELNEAFKIHFIDLVHTLSRQYYNLRDCHELNMLALPESIAEFNRKFIVKSELYNINTTRFDPPTCKDDIEVITLISLIHSTMCCNHDKTSFSIQLYEVYKDFPERQLSAAMRKVRTEQLMISANKLSKRHVESSPNRCLPLSASSYHLSITYQQQMYTKISYELFDGAFPRLREIIECTTNPKCAEPYAFSVWNSMMCFFLSELTHKSSFEIEIEVPKRILILDPTKNVHNETFQRMYARFNELEAMDMDDPLGELSAKKVPAQETQGAAGELTKSEIDEIALGLVPKLDELPNECFHLICIVNCHGQTFSLRSISLNSTNAKCSLNCLNQSETRVDEAIKSMIAQREVWGRLVTDYQEKPTQLSDEVEVNDFNVLAIYNHLLRRKIGVREERNVEHFQQVMDIVDEIVTNHEKRHCTSSLLGHDLDFDEFYDAETNAKKKPDVEITDKQHKFHDFLYVKTCKLSLRHCDPTSQDIDIKRMVAKRETILDSIVENAHWTSKITINADFVKAMTDVELCAVEVQLGIDVYGFIESRKEIGATTSMLKAKYEDREFLEKVLDIMLDMKMIMKTGVCQLTYVHRSFVKPWIVNTYHLKRLNREAVHPTSKKLMEIAESPQTPKELKRKLTADESNSDLVPKKKKIKADGDGVIPEPSSEAKEPTPSCSKEIGTRGRTKMSKRLESVTIPRGSRPDCKNMPQQIETFALKLAPWIRINGSLNRRVLDKYMGTILLYCIENFGLTLFQLCTRFHYLPPVHIKELVQYLEDFGCLTTTTFSKPTASLFSKYESSEIRSATDLDEFDDIIVEPTVDAVTRMSVFIGDKKYKEDFI